MNETKHTTGPWFCTSARNPINIYSENGRTVCDVPLPENPRNDTEYHEAQLKNAKLIAAAPDMLNALQEAMSAMEWMMENMHPAHWRLQSDAFNLPANAIELCKQTIQKATS